MDPSADWLPDPDHPAAGSRAVPSQPDHGEMRSKRALRGEAGMSYLAIDLGSSYIKSALIDPQSGGITQKCRMSVDAAQCQTDGLIYEIRMQAVLDTVLSLIRRPVSAFDFS